MAEEGFYKQKGLLQTGEKKPYSSFNMMNTKRDNAIELQ